MKRPIKLKFLFILSALMITTIVFGQKNKFLEGKKYTVQFYDVKPTGRGKAVLTNVLIKSGKIESDLMFEKLALGPEVYRVEADSVYTEEETEMHYVSIIVEASDGKNDYRWEATVINYDIEGTVTQSKNGIEKKKYEFAGTEKAKKK